MTYILGRIACLLGQHDMFPVKLLWSAPGQPKTIGVCMRADCGVKRTRA